MNKIEYSEKVLSKRFVGENFKQAYMKACKWLATNIIAHEDELGKMSYEISKEVNESQLPTVVLIINAIMDESEARERNCIICREAHSAFFLNDACNCSSCNANAYTRRLDDMIKVKVSSIRSKLKERMGD